ncbi:MAG: murein transglycosylase A [Alphaproteobacteria bacterium]
MRRFPFLLFAVLCLSSCVTADVSKAKKHPPFFLKPTAYSALPGWAADGTAATLAPLQKSCAPILKADAEKSFGPLPYAGKYADWQEICRKLPEQADDADARQFFVDSFTPYEIWNDKDRNGLFTGYYEPILHGALKKKKPYLIPLYARPADLITVNLGDFKPDLKGETVMGRVEGEKLVPYYTRAEIEDGKLKKTKQVVWVDNAVDAFFLHIQGSGQVILPHNQVMQVGYAAANGRPYTAIGKELIKRGALDKKNVSMQTIRAWLEEHPKEAPGVMDVDESFVFFRKLDTESPLGAQGVELTPGRSIAVDRKLIPYGAPVWLDAETPEKTGRLQRLMVAQDTGGAITGAVRGDFFWGAGAEAAEKAGIMKSAGQSYVLLPKTVEVPATFSVRPWWMQPFASSGVKLNGTPGNFAYNR